MEFCRITDPDEINSSTDRKCSYLINNRIIEPPQASIHQKDIVNSAKGQTKVKQHCTNTQHSLDSAPINNTLVQPEEAWLSACNCNCTDQTEITVRSCWKDLNAK